MITASTLLRLGLAFSTVVIVHYVAKLLRRVFHPYFSPLRDLKGPKSKSFFYGNLKEIFTAEAMELHERWREEYGPVYNYKGFFNSDRLVMMDNKATSHILSHPQIYEKPEQVRYSLGQILGQGLLFVEGEKHRQQRRIMSPAFGSPQIRELTSIFLEKSIQLRDLWSAEIHKASTMNGNESGEKVIIDVCDWLSKMTLDVIGLAGFDYSFNALNSHGKPNELNEAVRTMFHSPGGFGAVLPVLQAVFPPLRIFPSKRDRIVAAAQNTMYRIGSQLLAERRAFVFASANGRAGEKAGVEKKSVQGRDLLSLLVKANMATDLPAEARLDDADVLAQVPTFLVAGHETTSTAVTWALFALSTHPEAQAKLRAELLSVPSEPMPTMEELDRLPYLDAVVRETMRSFSPVPSTVRVANQDDIIPTEAQWEDKKGVWRREVRVTKGDSIFIPILATNRSKDLWGEDAHEFKPERWDNPPEAIQSIPGIWGNSLAFSGGSRACIGYRFSVIEMKAMVFVLIRAFQFDMSVPLEDVKSKSAVVRRPYLASDPEKGSQMPLWISPVRTV